MSYQLQVLYFSLTAKLEGGAGCKKKIHWSPLDLMSIVLKLILYKFVTLFIFLICEWSYVSNKRYANPSKAAKEYKLYKRACHRLTWWLTSWQLPYKQSYWIGWICLICLLCSSLSKIHCKELLESENLIKMHELLIIWKIRLGFRN